jgi:molybdopterin-guanine dinucleotide biosynthesis protein A
LYEPAAGQICVSVRGVRLPFSKRRYEPIPQPVGVVLAGGLGRRMGGRKTVVDLASRPLISYPLGALSAVLSEVAVIAKPDTELPSLPGVTVWIEPQEPRHPLVGIVQALGLAGNRRVLVCAADMPFVSSELVERLASTEMRAAPAVIAKHGDSVQPLLGVYRPGAARGLAGAVRDELPVREAVARIGPRLVEVDDPDELFNVNTPDDLLQAAAMLDRRARRVPWAPPSR